jgi:hypothetical protein
MTRLDLDHRAGRQTIIRVPGRRETYSTGRQAAFPAASRRLGQGEKAACTHSGPLARARRGKWGWGHRGQAALSDRARLVSDHHLTCAEHGTESALPSD